METGAGRSNHSWETTTLLIIFILIERILLTWRMNKMKFCKTIQTICRRPFDCQYCFNGFLYTEKFGPGYKISDPILQHTFEETNVYRD
jgi:hypothetical protein